MSYKEHVKAGKSGADTADNRTVLACLTEGVPLGFFHQEQTGPSLYRDYGLFRVVDHKDGTFILEGLRPVSQVSPVASA